MAMEIEFDAKEMRKFADQLARAGNKEIRDEVGKFLRAEAKKQLTVVRSTTAQKITPRSGNYSKGLKVGRRYKLRDSGTYAERVYAGKPAYHAGLVEFGHKAGKNFVDGRKIFGTAHDTFQPTFEQDAEVWVTTLLADKLN